MSGPPFHPPRVLTLEEVEWLHAVLIPPGSTDARLGALHSLILTAREGARRRVAEANSIEAKDPNPGPAKRSTKAERLKRLVKAADVVVTVWALAHIEGTALDPRGAVFTELNAALIAWVTG